MREKRSWSIGTKLALKCAIILSVILIAAFTVIIFITAQTSEETAINNIVSLAESDAATIKAQMEEPLNTARAIAQSMQGFKDIDAESRRSFYNSIMKNILEENEDIIGVWTCWEPNALDGLDITYVNTEASDSTGRYIPYWQWSDGEIMLTPLVDYETVGNGDYYLLAQNSGEETILEPYEYEINGENVLLTTVSVPIIDDKGNILGVAGIDLALSDLQEISFDNGGFESVNTFVLSNGGSYIITPDSNQVGASFIDSSQTTLETIMSAIEDGKSYQQDAISQYSGAAVKSIYVPVSIGDTTTPWSVVIEVDDVEVMESTIKMVYLMIIILVLLLAIIVVALLLIIKYSISKPIKETTVFAKELASGNLDESVTIKAQDEIGQLKGILDNEVRGAFKRIVEAQAIAEKQNQYQNEQVDKLVVNLERLAKGELHCDMAVSEADEDTEEIYKLFKNISDNLHMSIDTIKDYIEDISEVLNNMSEKNLNTGITKEYLGDFVALKNAINNIVYGLNKTMTEINTAADQVASGTQQVSDGSQEISQGATEQASSIEELTASTTKIAEQTRQNAESASRANALTLEAKENAAHGNEQMKTMQQAMADINESSTNINKIIKVIDDIAFQTNILALNAAVEAARAGVHGKGFAVVAEEVRNLAAKSADAANQTTDLIENSIKRTEAGTKIANETAAALAGIVDGVEKVAELAGTIASASNDQASAISQVNNGIEQMGQVVQTNSATSEEQAAAAEELSSQAEMLKRMVGQFQLKTEQEVLQNLRPEKSEAEVVKEDVQYKPQIRLSDTDFDKY